MRRYEGRELALDIVMSVVNQNPIAPSIQHEMVEEKKELVQTAAGISVNEELARLEKKHSKVLEEIKREHHLGRRLWLPRVRGTRSCRRSCSFSERN
jgi:hypothetical protein